MTDLDTSGRPSRGDPDSRHPPCPYCRQAATDLLAALAALRLPDNAALVNVVHDELVVECGPEQAEQVAAEVERAMTVGFLTIFPDACTRGLVDAHSGPNWAAAKG